MTEGEREQRRRPGVPGTAPARVAVRNPRGRAVSYGAGERTLSELREQTGVGDQLLRSLMQAQLRLALRVFVVFGSLLGGLPVLLASSPRLTRIDVFGMPLPWVILGIGVYPLLVLLGWLYVRVAERNEREFVEIIERS
jgi:putative solute:sodium symporter small subunit